MTYRKVLKMLTVLMLECGHRMEYDQIPRIDDDNEVSCAYCMQERLRDRQGGS